MFSFSTDICVGRYKVGAARNIILDNSLPLFVQGKNIMGLANQLWRGSQVELICCWLYRRNGYISWKQLARGYSFLTSKQPQMATVQIISWPIYYLLQIHSWHQKVYVTAQRHGRMLICFMAYIWSFELINEFSFYFFGIQYWFGIWFDMYLTVTLLNLRS